MPYIIVERKYNSGTFSGNGSIVIEGLPGDARSQLCSEINLRPTTDSNESRTKFRVTGSTKYPVVGIFNYLERLGFYVVTSAMTVSEANAKSGYTRESWTLHRNEYGHAMKQ